MCSNPDIAGLTHLPPFTSAPGTARPLVISLANANNVELFRWEIALSFFRAADATRTSVNYGVSRLATKADDGASGAVADAAFYRAGTAPGDPATFVWSEHDTHVLASA
jgi:hypothetical protein